MAPANSLDDLRRRIGHGAAPGAFAALAEEHRRAGRLDDAVAVCREGLAHYPTYVSARVTLGRALLDMGDISSAVEELQQAVAQAPDNLAASRALASAEALMPADFPYPGTDAPSFSAAHDTIVPPLFEPAAPLPAMEVAEVPPPVEASEAVDVLPPLDVPPVPEAADVPPTVTALAPMADDDADVMSWLSPPDATPTHALAIPDWPGSPDVDALDDSSVNAFIEEEAPEVPAGPHAIPASAPNAWDETIYAPIMPLPVWPGESHAGESNSDVSGQDASGPDQAISYSRSPDESSPEELPPHEVTAYVPATDAETPSALTPDEETRYAQPVDEETPYAPTVDEALDEAVHDVADEAAPVAVAISGDGFVDAGLPDATLGDDTLGDWAALPPETTGGDWSGSVDAVLAEVFARAGGLDIESEPDPSPVVGTVETASPVADGAGTPVADGADVPLVASLEALLAAIRRRRAELATAHSDVD